MNLIDDALSGLRKSSAQLYERRRSLRPAELSRAEQEPPTSLEDLPDMIRQRTAAYLDDPNPQRALLLALPAGSGKTTAMVALAETVAAQGKRVIYSGPRHDLFIDLMDMAQRPDWWHHWQPRRIGEDSLNTTCRWSPQMERWLSRGYEAMKFCTNSRICGWAYVEDGCPYHAQRRQQRPIIYAMHQHVAVGHPLMEQASLVIGDELPLGAMLYSWLIPSSHIVVKSDDEEVERVLWSLRELCTRTAPEGGWSGPALLQALGGAEHVHELIQSHSGFQIDADMMTPQLRDPDDVDQTDYLFLPALLSILGQESSASIDGQEDWIRRVHCTTDGLKLLMRRRPKRLPPHVIWCDATGDPRMYERLLGMPIEIVRPNVVMQGTIYQIHDSLNNRSALASDLDSPKMRQLRQQVEQIGATHQYQSSATITYKGVRELFEADGHFGAERGTNRLADKDALIVIGTPQPPQTQIIEIAAMLFDERIRKFNTAWTTRDIAYEGRAHAYPVAGFWDEPDLHIVLQQYREAELIQTLHRARPLRRRVDIWLLTNIPLPGITPELLSVQELFNAPAGVDPYRWPALIEWAAERIDRHGMLVSTDIAEYLGMQQKAAREYMYVIAGQLNLTVGNAPSTGRGRPALAILGHQSVKD